MKLILVGAVVIVLLLSFSFKSVFQNKSDEAVVVERPVAVAAKPQEASLSPVTGDKGKLEKRTTTPPPPADINELLKQGKTELAINRFKEILAADPNNEMALMALANLYMKNPQTRAEAETLYKKALDTNSENREALEKYLDLQQKPGQAGAPLQSLEKLVQENPESPNIAGAYARTLANKGQFAEAQATMERALQDPTADAMAYSSLKEMAERTGNHAGAALAMERAIGRQEDYIAELRRKNLSTADAERSLARSQAFCVDQLIASGQPGDISKAEALISSIAAKNPNHPALKSLRASLERAKRA